MIMRSFVGVCRRGGLKVNADKSKVMVLDREEGLEFEVLVNGMQLEHVIKIKYLRCVLNEYESVTDDADCHMKVTSGRRVAGAVRSLVNARVQHVTLVVPVVWW